MMIKADVTPELQAAVEKWTRKPDAILVLPPGLELATVLMGVWVAIWPERKRP